MRVAETPRPLERRQFASDNYAGICPEAWRGLEEANRGHAPAYGDDEWTARAADGFRELFETDCDVFFAFNGTGSNALALASLCQSYHSVLCHPSAHVETDECGAPEFFSNGTKLLLVGGENGKIDPSEVEQAVSRRTDIHYPKPRALSITQATELGTVYTPEELHLLGETARRCGLKFHMDGARFANAVASLSVPPKAITWEAGVDVLCFGGTKNGIGVGEAVIFFDRSLSEEFAYRCKQAGQLASKMRFLAAPWTHLLEDGAWLRHAAHANRCARLLESELRAITCVTVVRPAQANSVFVDFPEGVAEALRARGWRFYNFIGGAVRLMCSWDTTEEDIAEFLGDVRTITGDVRR